MSTETRGESGLLGAFRRMHRPERPRMTAFLIATGYCLVALAWIWGSDRVLHSLHLERSVENMVEVWKGTGWIVLTSVVLFLLIARPLVRLTRARAESEERARELEAVLDAVPVAVWIARDPACRVIVGNRVGRELLGAEEPVNLSMSAPSGERPRGFRVLSGRSGAELAAEELPVQVAARTGAEVRDFEEVIAYEDGRRLTLLGNAVPLRDGRGRVTGAVGAFVDVSEREAARREIERNELILEQAQELGRIGSWVSEHAREGGALEWSRETCRIFGLSPEEFNGRVETFFDMVHPEDREAVRRAGDAAKSGQRDYEIEHRIIRADGTVRWVHERARIERDGAGAPLRMIGVCQDITERRETEAALRKSEALHRMIVETCHEGVWLADGSWRTTFANGRLAKILGRTVEEMIGRNVLDFVAPEEHAPMLERLRTRQRGESGLYDTRLLCADGRRIWVTMAASPVRDEAGGFAGALAMVTDITERREAEERVRRSEAMYRMIVETCEEGVWLVGPEWTTTFVNQRMADILGRAPADVLGRNVLEFLPEDQRERTLTHMREREAGIAAQHEYRLLRPDGRDVWGLFATNAITDESGRFRGALAMVTDITDRREMELSLRDSEARFRGLFDALPDPAWDWDVEEDRTTFSATWPGMLGYADRAEAERDARWEDRLHPEDRDRVLGSVDAAVRGASELYEEEYRIRCRDGSYKWVLSRGRVVERDAEGRALRMIGGITDMTERRRAEHDLRLSEARYRKLIESAPDAVVVLDVESMRFADFNGQAAELFRLSPEQLRERGPIDLSPERQPDGRPSAEAGAEYVRLAAEGEEPRFEWTHLAADGTEIPCEVRLVRLPDRDRVMIRGSITNISERKLAEARLRERDALLRKLTMQVPGMIFQYLQAPDGTATFPYASEGARAIYGASPEELRATAAVAWNRIHPEDVPRVAEAVNRSVRTMEMWRSEYRVILPERGVRWLEGHSMPERLPDGSILWHGHISDITDRRRDQEALRESEERLRIFIGSAPAGVAMLDRDMRYLAYSRRWLSDYGLADQDLRGRSHYEIFPEIDDRWKTIHRRCLETGVAEHCAEDRFERADGSVDFVRWEIQPWRDSSGAVGGLVFFTEMITERKRAEMALRASEEKYRLVLRATSDAMWEYEPATDRLHWGDNVETMFGVKIEDLGEFLNGWSDRIHPEDAESTCGTFNEAIARGDERWTGEYRFRKGDGTYAVVLDRAYMLRGPDGHVVRIIGAMTDVTERRLNEQLMAGQARTLGLLVDGEPLERVLEEIVRILEEIEPGCLGSVVLLEGDGRTMRSAAAPSLPESYSRSLNGAQIGPAVGSCGAAMHQRERVIVRDIETDPLWMGLRHLALPHGLRACWSEPIVGAGGAVLGSMAMYYREPRGPGEHELRSISWAARLAGLAIERRRAEEQLRKRENDLRDLLHAVPDLMFRVDKNGRYLEYHAPRPADLFAPPEKFMGRTVPEIMPGDLGTRCMTFLRRAIESGEPQLYEYSVQNARGTRHWEVRITRCAEEQALLLVRDITIRRTAERQLKESQQRLSLLVQQSPLGVIVWNLDFTVAEWNTAAEHIFGWSADQAIGRSATFILPPSAHPHVDKVWAALCEGRGGARSTNPNLTADGREIYCEWYNSPLVDADGRIFAVVSIVDDITEQRLAQQRQQLMMAELDHRVKNNLAAVISLAEQSGRSTSSFAEFRESFLGRVRALSRLHNALAATRWEGANLLNLVQQTLEAFGQDASSQAMIDGPSVVLPPRVAQSLGMAINELCTNAIKYGALSRDGGRVHVRWRLTTPESGGDPGALQRIVLEWAESGGPPVRKPERRGFGTELIEGAISYELGGSVSMQFDPTGLCCRLEVPLPRPEELETDGIETRRVNRDLT